MRVIGLKAIQLLEDGVNELGLIPDTQKINQLMQYAQLLLKWNKVYNLTAITELNHIVSHHLLDGLTVVPHITPHLKIIDIGSGMGVPGIVLAIWYPANDLVLLDSNHKKCTFLKQVAIELGLTNVAIANSKVESYIPLDKFDVVISRAFASTKTFLELTKHLVTTDGYLLAMKGRALQILPNCRPIKVKIPLCSDERVLLKCYPEF